MIDINFLVQAMNKIVPSDVTYPSDDDGLSFNVHIIFAEYRTPDKSISFFLNLNLDKQIYTRYNEFYITCIDEINIDIMTYEYSNGRIRTSDDEFFLETLCAEDSHFQISTVQNIKVTVDEVRYCINNMNNVIDAIYQLRIKQYEMLGKRPFEGYND